MRRNARPHRRQRRSARGDGDHDARGGDERWAISYADLVTLLFAFFATLYATATLDEAKANALEEAVRNAFDRVEAPNPSAPRTTVCPAVPPPEPTPPPIPEPQPDGPKWTPQERLAAERLRELVDRIRHDPALRGRIELSPDPRGIRLTLGAAAFFKPGDSQLRAEAVPAMAVLGEALARHTGGIVVEGHTDDTPVRGGPFRSNWELSTARATEVVAILVEEHHVPADRLSAAGYAEHRPLADNDTSAGRARNRRVDIVMIGSPAPPSIPREQAP